MRSLKRQSEELQQVKLAAERSVHRNERRPPVCAELQHKNELTKNADRGDVVTTGINSKRSRFAVFLASRCSVERPNTGGKGFRRRKSDLKL